MPEPTIDPRWTELFSVLVHDIRTPMTVINGYLDMLLKETFGPLNDRQRHLLSEIRKSYTKVYGILAEGSELTNIERGKATYTRKPADLHTILRTAVEQLPQPDREIRVDLELEDGDAPIQADADRLAKAFRSIIAGLRREVILTDYLVVREQRNGREFQIHIGDGETVQLFDGVSPDDLPIFNEWRGGVGMTLAVARRILNAHGARILAAPHAGVKPDGEPDERRSGALILLPR